MFRYITTRAGKKNLIVPETHRSLSDWVFQRNTGTYERPFASSEVVFGTMSHQFDGTGNYLYGATFKVRQISQEAVVTSVREALGRIRFFAPIVACNIKVYQAQPLQQSFVYKPASNAEEVEAWAEASLTIERANGRTFKECLLQQVEKSFPYVHPNGHEQYFNFYLICHEEENVYSLSAHMPHCVVDGRPVVHLLRSVFDTIAFPNKGQNVRQLEWGTECKNLPDSPATLAKRNLKLQSSNNNSGLIWEEGWRELNEKMENIFDRKELGESLKPSRPEPTGKGPITRVSHYVDAASLDSIKSELKKLGLTMAVLIPASHMLTVLRRSQPLKPGAYITLDCTIIDTSRFFPPSDSLIVSSRLAFVPLVIEAKDIDWNASTRHQLISMMKSLDNQMKDYLQYPQLTLIDTIGPTKPDVAPMHPYTCNISYIGVIDMILPPVILNESGDVVLETLDFDAMFRQTSGFQRPSQAYWSFRGNLSIMLQSCDNWDSDLFKQVLEETAENMLQIVPNGGECQPFQRISSK